MATDGRKEGVLQAVWSLLRTPVPPQSRRDLAFGSLILIVFLVQVFTGILLSLYYHPSPPLVAESVQYLMRDVEWGWLVRGVHHWSSHTLIALCAINLVRMFLAGSYRGAGSPNWYVGVVVLAVIVSATYSGELLAWDDRAYWRIVRTLGWIESFGSFGHFTAGVMRGGNEISATTLARTYSAHSQFLPWLVWSLLLANLWFLARRHHLRQQAGGAR
jgi:quinol-cytochrome oxidoreductase complex cytochrome b subunit